MEHRYDIIKFPKSFKGDTVIDIGCNIGYLSSFYSKILPNSKVLGLDKSKKSIQKCPKHIF